MKKIIVALASLTLLASCGTKAPETTTGTTSTGTEATIVATGSTEIKPLTLTADENITGPAIEVGSATKLRYILRDTNENGEVLDTNVSNDGTEKPELEVIVGETSLIKGFEKGIIGMKAGEVKSFTVSPEEGYGTGTIVREYPLEMIAPEFTITIPVANIEAIMTQTVEIAKLTEEDRKLLGDKKAGEILEEHESGKTILKERTDTSITVEMHNLDNPFYGKKIEVGTEGTTDGTTAKIEKIENDMATVRIITDKNPFTKDTYKVGATGNIIDNYGHTTEVTIVAINEDNVSVSMENTDKMANKTLHFTVKAISVIPPTTTTQSGVTAQ